ncbi:MAG: aminotransferase class V-fold PLP-dependent enzyme [Oscillospiraceae bacterium]|nr:aminotransferase class V-fold PLP-dependent enzyme [Oscillospiraceae bacterium]
MIYLDSAATTLQKPGSVARAMCRAVTTMASPGRGGYSAADSAARTAFECREEAARLFGLENPEHVIFTCNATHALNIAIKSLVKAGDTVLVSGYEHNAVTRPLSALGVTIKVADGTLFDPEDMIERFERMLTPNVDAVICTHVSNVFGYILPIDEIARLCRQRSVPLIVDASQSAGRLSVDISRWNAAFVAMPGHKGLYGPQGTGLLLCSAPACPIMEGGTGSESMLQQMPAFLPDRLEAGTHNIPGVSGLLEGLRFVKRVGVKNIGRHETDLIRHMAKELSHIPGVHVFYAPQNQSGALSFTVDGLDCEDVGQRLAAMNIAVRCGLHCAPLAHRTAGTLQTGTVRASVSAFSTEKEIGRFVNAVKKVVSNQ